MSDESEFHDPEWKVKYKKYNDLKYLELLQLNLNNPISKLELLTLGATTHKIEDKEFMVVKLPFHTNDPFVFYKEGYQYFKW